MDNRLYRDFVNILGEELLPAMGCTEPISIAYAAALARDALGEIPERTEISVSGNILKNVKSVVVPNTGGMKGVTCAAAAGIIAGDSSKKLEVIAGVTAAEVQKIAAYLKTASFSVEHSRSGCVFDIGVKVYKGENSAFVRIVGHHTNVVLVQKNGESVFSSEAVYEENSCRTDRSILTVDKIVEFADGLNVADVYDLIKRQIDYNKAISDEGLKNDYGAKVGKVLLNSFGKGVHNRAKAAAAAGSDARMNGCSKPVVIVSGSGNQGMAASLPLITYAEYLNLPEEKLIRGLVVSDLVTIHLKTGIGRLSAYCGAVSAGCGAGAGICYLYGGNAAAVSCTIVNALAINSGVICDGAKSSCAAKIASAVEAGILGFEMTRKGSNFCGGDGILADCVESTIDNVGDVARVGMRETDEEIIRLMIKKMLNEFSRTELLLGKDGAEKLSKSRVALFGVGGVGGYCAEALARSGVGEIHLIDSDKVSVTNINRQIIATQSSLGKLKTQVMRERINDINPACTVVCHDLFFTEDCTGLSDFSAFDFVVDAIDTVSGKIAVITRAKAAGTPVISCMGSGNKLDPTKFQVIDIYKTTDCPLARVMRRELKKRGVTELKTVFSSEPPVKFSADAAEESGKVIGSVSFVPPVAGLIAAGEVIKYLAGVKK